MLHTHMYTQCPLCTCIFNILGYGFKLSILSLMFSAVGQPPERIKNVHKISMKVKHCCLNKFYKKVMTHHILQLSNNNLVIDGSISFGCVSTQKYNSDEFIGVCRRKRRRERRVQKPAEELNQSLLR